MTNRLLIYAAAAAYGLSFFAPVWVPLIKRPDFNCNNKPPCCNNEKHWNHKYDCER